MGTITNFSSVDRRCITCVNMCILFAEMLVLLERKIEKKKRMISWLIQTKIFRKRQELNLRGEVWGENLNQVIWSRTFVSENWNIFESYDQSTTFCLKNWYWNYFWFFFNHYETLWPSITSLTLSESARINLILSKVEQYVRKNKQWQ